MFQSAGKAVLGILKHHGEGVAGGVVRRLHTDVTRMYKNRSAMELNAIVAWIDGMSGELRTYAGRMSAMLGAALDENDFVEIRQKLAAGSMTVRLHEIMYMGEAHDPAAWILIGDRRHPNEPFLTANNACQNL